MPILFAATIFVSALLLFFIQPMFAKIILPLLGGALSQTFALLEKRQPPARQIAAVGLGSGTIACNGQPGQQWTFYCVER